jgi:hypothetical protein
MTVHEYCALTLRLRSRLDAWRRTRAAPQVLDYIASGHKVPWITKPKHFHHGALRVPDDMREEWSSMRQRYLDNGALRLVAQGTGYTSRAFLIKKKGGGLRLIVDLRFINLHVHKYACKYESLQHLQRLAKQGYYMVSFDLADAYHCIGIHADDQKYMSFCIDGEYFVCTALPFGYTNSPYVFTKVARHLTKLLRSPAACSEEGAAGSSLLVLAYLDDFLVLGKSAQDCMAAAEHVLHVCSMLGFKLKLEKCQLHPTQVLEHLGMIIDFKSGHFRLTEQRMAKVRSSAKALLMSAARNKRVVSLHRVQAFCGLAQSCKLAVVLCDHYLRSLYDCTSASFWQRGFVKLSHVAMQDLKFWVTLPPEHVGAPIWKPPATMRVFTDSSSYAYGAVLPDGSMLSRAWVGAELNWHINIQELVAVHRVLSACPDVHNCVVEVCVDNKCVLHWLSSWRARNSVAQQWLRRLVQLCTDRGCVIQPLWVPSADNPADAPSRECSLATPLKPAIALNNWLEHMGISTRWRPPLQGRQPWHLLNQPTPKAFDLVFGHPNPPPVVVMLPPGSVARVLQHLEGSSQPAIIITPLWEAQFWYPQLVGAAHWLRQVGSAFRHHLLSNVPKVWGRSPIALWGINLPAPPW